MKNIRDIYNESILYILFKWMTVQKADSLDRNAIETLQEALEVTV